jgi:hypothetical protein
MSGNDYKSSSPEAQLGGARRKNGHKSNCTCHICENMKNKAKRGGYQEDMEKEQLKKMGGSKKKNGHKPDCGCPICKNMKNVKKGKKGGNLQRSNRDPDVMDVEESEEILGPSGEIFRQRRSADWVQEEPNIYDIDGGRKKKGNGHKANCKCPICKNMKKSKKGGQDPDTDYDIESGVRGDIEEGVRPAKKEIIEQKSPQTDNQTKGKEIVASDDEYDILVAAEKGEAGPNVVGGTRKRRGSRKSSKRHMKKGRKTMRRHRKRSHRRR